MQEENRPRPSNRPPDGEIPDILEWKLDVLMAQLERLGGGSPAEHNPRVGSGGTRERLPDPDKFNPLTDPLPGNYPGIPAVLEFKLDVIIRALGRLVGGPGAPVMLNVNLNLNLAPIPLLLALILAAILATNALLVALAAQLAAITAVLTAIFAFLAFFIIQVVVTRIIFGERGGLFGPRQQP